MIFRCLLSGFCLYIFLFFLISGSTAQNPPVANATAPNPNASVADPNPAPAPAPANSPQNPVPAPDPQNNQPAAPAPQNNQPVAPPTQNNRPADTVQFCSKCFGRSVCVIKDGVPKCHCPPDYHGQYCESPIQKLPATCDKSECENGGICEQGFGTTFCVCPRHYVGRNCSRVALWVEVAMNLYSNGYPLDWDKINKTEPGISDAACNKLIMLTLRGPDPVLSTSIFDCSLRHIEQTQIGDRKGIRTYVLLKFDPGYNSTAFAAANVRRQLETAPSLGYSIGADFNNDKTITVTNLDPCASGINDCSVSAKCEFDGFTYTCQCNKFYTDGGAAGKTLPGRHCYFNHALGSLIATVVLTPFIICSVFLFFWMRKQAFLRFWILPTGEHFDKEGLVETPQYSYTV